MSSKLFVHHIVDTDRNITYCKVSPRLIKQMLDDYPIKPPQPPLNDVTWADGHVKKEPNTTDPEYLKALADYNTEIALAINDFLIERGVVITLSKEDQEEVKELKRWWQQRYGKDLPGSDKFIFVAHILIGTPEDLRELVNAITRRSQATLEATQEALATFPDQV
jgi:hypothetical protein